MGAELRICDGCNVLSGYEHRCHEGNAFVKGEPTGKSCQCRECYVAQELFSGNHSHDWKTKGSGQGSDAAGNEFLGIKIRCNVCSKEIYLKEGEYRNLLSVRLRSSKVR
jgi:hypothetical protein